MLKYKNICYILAIPFAFLLSKIFSCLNIGNDMDSENFILEISIFIILMVMSPHIIYAVFMFIRKQYINNLKQNGQLIQTKFVEVTEKRRMVLDGGRHSRPRTQYAIVCEGKNPIDGTLMTFKSEEMSGNPTDYIKGNIESIDVYISNKNPKKYYVDVEQIKKGTSNYYKGMLKGMFK